VEGRYVPFSLWVFHRRWVSDPTELGNTCNVGAALSMIGSCALPRDNEGSPRGEGHGPPSVPKAPSPNIDDLQRTRGE
jgi:hypothetical protein